MQLDGLQKEDSFLSELFWYLVYGEILFLKPTERDSASAAGDGEPGGGHLYIKTGTCMGP